MTSVLVLMTVVCQLPGISPLGTHDRVRVGKKNGFAVGDTEFAFTAKGPRKIGLKLYGSADLHGRSIWLDIERNDEFVSENTLALVDRSKGPKKHRAQADLELSVPAGTHTYRVRSSDAIVVVFARAGRGGALVAADETPLGASTSPEPDQPAGDEPTGESTDASGGDEPSGDEPGGDEPDEPGDEPSVTGSDVGGQVGYDGGFFVRSADKKFLLKQNVRLQLRHTLTSTSLGDSRAQTSAFSVPRAHLEFVGHLFDAFVRYRVETDFGQGYVYLKDCWADVAFVPDALVLRVGQWKRPFSRQFITSSRDVQLVDRALTNENFAVGRDVGIGLHNRYEESPELEWAVALVNGEPLALSLGSTGLTTAPAIASYGVVARFGYNYGGIDGYNEPDFDGGPLRFGIAASGIWQLDSDNDGDAAIGAELDFILKVAGLATNGAFYLATAQSGVGRLEQSLAAMGFHFQAGFLIADLIEPTARFAMYMPEGGGSLQELTAGFALYVFQHTVKVQADLSFLVPEGAGFADDLRARFQFQMAF
jgi:hypothetical protein